MPAIKPWDIKQATEPLMINHKFTHVDPIYYGRYIEQYEYYEELMRRYREGGGG